jgi:hypothetical protein
MVSNQENGVLGVEGDVQTLGLFHGSVLAEVSMLLLMEIPNEESTLVGTSSEYSCTVRGPFDISDGVLEIESHDRSGDVHIPHFDGPIG